MTPFQLLKFDKLYNSIAPRTEAYIKSCQISIMNYFAKVKVKSRSLFSQDVPSKMFVMILNRHLS